MFFTKKKSGNIVCCILRLHYNGHTFSLNLKDDIFTKELYQEVSEIIHIPEYHFKLFIGTTFEIKHTSHSNNYFFVKTFTLN